MRRLIAVGLAAAALLPSSAAPVVFAAEKPSLPYKAIEHSEFIPAKDATFMSDRDRMIGVTGGEIAKAYPAGILAQHGLVRDRLPDGPIAVTW
ncbi:MAG: DUF3179 domain-containing protein [Bryobacterales bacterium]|nr:DUF3179 domain-containing protein [Bryobacterales bacterium]